MRGKVLFFSSALLAVLVAWAAFRTPSVDLDSALAGKRVLVCGASQGIGAFHERSSLFVMGFPSCVLFALVLSAVTVTESLP